MKTIFAIVISALLSINSSLGQITLDHVYTTDGPQTAFKLSNSGLKYYSEHYDQANNNNIPYFFLYNPDHSIFRTINIPQITGKKTRFISWVSETLFDTDTLIEYMLYYEDSITFTQTDVAVLNELGNTLLYVDSVNFTAGGGDRFRGFIEKPIFPDGNQTKLYLRKLASPFAVVVYNLPGQVTCLECDNGIIIGIQPPDLPSENNQSLAYPNPSDNYVKIKYTLPPNYNRAYINLLDITGKLLKQKEIGKQFSEVYITHEELKGGAYIYQIVVDDKITGTGKIIKL